MTMNKLDLKLWNLVGKKRRKKLRYYYEWMMNQGSITAPTLRRMVGSPVSRKGELKQGWGVTINIVDARRDRYGWTGHRVPGGGSNPSAPACFFGVSHAAVFE